MNREEAINVVKCNWPEGRHQLSEALRTLIPELQESEDERIRREMIEYFHGCIQRNKKSGFRVEQIKGWIAYIERQKEYIEDIRQYAYNKGLVDAEQKPAEWSKEDEMRLKEALEVLNESIKHLPMGYGYTKDVMLVTDWLTSLPKRFNLIPKQEWSEEDKRAIHDAHCWLDEYAGFIVSVNKDKAKMLWKLSEKLKSLRPYPHWKPSEEQLEALKLIVSNKAHYAPVLHEIALDTLYSDLQKLL